MIRAVAARDKVARMLGLASRKRVDVERAARSGCFKLTDAAGRRIVHPDGSRVLTVDEAIAMLKRMPEAVD